MTTQIQDAHTTRSTDVAPVKLQAPTIAAQAAVVEEADGNKAALFQRLVTAAKAFAQAEDSLSKGLAADMVLAIVPLLKLPTKARPKYAAIAEQITLAMGRGDISARTVAKLPDETLKDRFAGKPAYKQAATRWVNLARYEALMFNKAEQKHQERTNNWSMTVHYNGQQYDSPVTMLRAGVAYTTVHQAFRNVCAPTFIDFSVMDGKATEKAAREASKKLTVKIRTVNDKGDVVKGSVPIAGSAPLTHGAIIGLLSELKAPLSQKRFDELTAALVLVAPVQA